MLSEEDRSTLAASVRELSESCATVARDLVGRDLVRDGSPVGVHLASDNNVPSYGGFPIVREALVDAMFATFAGADHARSWVDLMTRGEATVSLPTVARGALEGFAKAHYLLSARTTADLVQRHLASVRFDLRHPLLHSQFEDWTGAPIDKAEFPKVHDRIGRSLGLPRIKRPGAQALVGELLTAGMRPGHEASQEIYSQLSGPAHSGMSALGMYVIPQTSEFQFPRILAGEQTSYLFSGLAVVGEDWLRLYAQSAVERVPWVAARSRAERAIRRVSDWY